MVVFEEDEQGYYTFKLVTNDPERAYESPDELGSIGLVRRQAIRSVGPLPLYVGQADDGSGSEADGENHDIQRSAPAERSAEEDEVYNPRPTSRRRLDAPVVEQPQAAAALVEIDVQGGESAAQPLVADHAQPVVNNDVQEMEHVVQEIPVALKHKLWLVIENHLSGASGEVASPALGSDNVDEPVTTAVVETRNVLLDEVRMVKSNIEVEKPVKKKDGKTAKLMWGVYKKRLALQEELGVIHPKKDDETELAYSKRIGEVISAELKAMLLANEVIRAELAADLGVPKTSNVDGWVKNIVSSYMTHTRRQRRRGKNINAVFELVKHDWIWTLEDFPWAGVYDLKVGQDDQLKTFLGEKLAASERFGQMNSLETGLDSQMEL